MTFFIVALAVHRLTRLIVSDTITEPLRNRVLSRWPSDDAVFTDEWVTETAGEPQTIAGADVFYIDGTGWMATKPHWLGTLITCTWCASFWIATLATVGLLLTEAVALPALAWWLLPFAFSSVVGLLESVST